MNGKDIIKSTLLEVAQDTLDPVITMTVQQLIGLATAALQNRIAALENKLSNHIATTAAAPAPGPVAAPPAPTVITSKVVDKNEPPTVDPTEKPGA